MRFKAVLSVIAISAASIVAAACSQAASQPTPPPSAPTSAPVALPDTTASSVWSYLQSVDYQETWHLWPGKGEKYQGTQPHGMLLTTYLNAAALDALNNRAGSMPDGAIIVKENYMPDGTYDAATIMYKVQGYNPDANDWWWAKIKPDGTVEAEGQVTDCQRCHAARESNDYIYTGSLN